MDTTVYQGNVSQKESLGHQAPAGEKNVEPEAVASRGPALSSHDLIVGYGEPLVKGINLRVSRGQITTLIGPNGAGKSTMLKTFCALIQPLGGAVYLSGEPMSRLDGQARAQMLSCLLTERPKTELASAAEIVAAGRYPFTGKFGTLTAEDWQVVDETMELTSTAELKEQDFMQLSDGQQQRVLLARALAQEPRMLILDEPTSYLDIRYQIELLNILRGLARDKKIAIVMSLHELDLARIISDEVVCVKDGAIFARGSSEEIFVPEVIDALFDLAPNTFDARSGCVRWQVS
ncbi:MAG: ABC transporter ATP-binding protein [Atopobiaceae bacterium]|jgi:iron complex transport system ATP-binding protein